MMSAEKFGSLEVGDTVYRLGEYVNFSQVARFDGLVQPFVVTRLIPGSNPDPARRIDYIAAITPGGLQRQFMRQEIFESDQMAFEWAADSLDFLIEDLGKLRTRIAGRLAPAEAS